MDPLINLLKILVLLFFLLISACGPLKMPQMPDLPFAVTLTAEGRLFETDPAPQTLISPATDTPGELPTPSEIISPSPTSLLVETTPTAEATYIPFLPTATETLLPPLELPTEQPRLPSLVAWVSLPTYPGDSEPGRLFRLDYDPAQWAQTQGNFGELVLANRSIEYCVISPWTGRGLPVEWKVTQDFRTIGRSTFQISKVSVQDTVKFVSYTGGDDSMLTSFQVSFTFRQDECLQQAETVLGTLQSVSETPSPQPTITATP
jgi:hypothetical protein